MKIIDLFCGAGGFSLGAHQAGFSTALAVDKDPVLTSAFSRNFPNATISLQDLTHASGESLREAAGIAATEDVGLIGGPPCQGFSLIGRRVMADPRNALLQHYFRIVSEIKPRFFVMENVPGLLLGEARRLLDEAIASLHGYEILGPLKVNANDYGAATRRERVLVIGFRGVNPITNQMLEIGKGVKPTVRDAISDIPSPRKSGAGRYRRITKLSDYAVRARTIVDTLGEAEKKKQVLEGVVCGLLPTDHAASVISRFSTVLQGASDPISRCPRLSWKAASPTLRAGTGPDHGSFQSVRPIHPTNNRVITVREAARLQGFPDWFEFHETKWHSFRMIGNSVSPPLAQSILRVVRNNL